MERRENLPLPVGMEKYFKHLGAMNTDRDLSGHKTHSKHRAGLQQQGNSVLGMWMLSPMRDFAPNFYICMYIVSSPIGTLHSAATTPWVLRL